MIQFIVYPRPISSGKHKTTAPSIMQVHIELVQGVDDPSVMWMTNGEYKAYILSPYFLYELREGSTEKVAPIYYSFNFYETASQARLIAEKIVRSEFEFNLRKYETEFTEEDIQAKFKEIQEILL